MKKNVLIGSASLVILATSVATGTLLFSSNTEHIGRLMSVSGVLGLGSIGLFFVGLALRNE